MVLVPLLLRPPWVRRQGKGLQQWADGQWQALQGRDKGVLGSTEAQVAAASPPLDLDACKRPSACPAHETAPDSGGVHYLAPTALRAGVAQRLQPPERVILQIQVAPPVAAARSAWTSWRLRSAPGCITVQAPREGARLLASVAWTACLQVPDDRAQDGAAAEAATPDDRHPAGSAAHSAAPAGAHTSSQPCACHCRALCMCVQRAGSTHGTWAWLCCAVLSTLAHQQHALPACSA